MNEKIQINPLPTTVFYELGRFVFKTRRGFNF